MADAQFLAKVWKNGKIIPIEEAYIHPGNHSLHYGSANFEGERYYWNEERKELFGFRIQDHYDRMLRNAALLSHRVSFTAEELRYATNSLIRSLNHRGNLYIRPLIYVDTNTVGIPSSKDASRSILIMAIPMDSYFKNVGIGLKLKTVSWRRVKDIMIPPRAKISGAYVNSFLAVNEARECGADEALILTDDDRVAEGSGENIFIVRYRYDERGHLSHRSLITPPESDCILPGITRDTIMQIAPLLYPNRISVLEQSFDRSAVLCADECFLTGTACEITAVLSLDGKPIGTGNLRSTTSEIQQAYVTIVYGKKPNTDGQIVNAQLEALQKSWLTPVYSFKA